MSNNRVVEDNYIKRKLRKALSMLSMTLIVSTLVFGIFGCGIKNGEGDGNSGGSNSENSMSESNYAKRDFHPEDGFIRESEDITSGSEGNMPNGEFSLSVPTYVTKIDGMWFVVDCYHDQIIYSENMGTPLNEWKVLTKEAKQPHTIAGDGKVILVDDTENNRVLVFEKNEQGYVNTQLFNDIGKRPHYTVYDEKDKAFYVWSSTTGEMYIFRHEEGSAKMYLTEIRDAGTKDTYIRSFYMDEDEIYFVSGICADGQSSGILICDKYSFEIKEKIDIPAQLAGMVALRKDGGYYYLTISTDITGNQDAATMIRTKDLHNLMENDYEDVYATYFVGGGTPYNITEVDGTLYLTEHRVPGHSIWSYRIENDGIVDVQALY